MEREILDAFSACTEVAPRELAEATNDDEGAAEIFGGKLQCEVNGHMLIRKPDAMWFLTPKVFRYHLPTLMIPMLKDELVADVLWGRFLGQFAGVLDAKRTREILGALSDPQVVSLIQFLRLLPEKYSVLEPQAAERPITKLIERRRS